MYTKKEQTPWLEKLLIYVNQHKGTELIVGIGSTVDEELSRIFMETELERLALEGKLDKIHMKKTGQGYSENEVKKEEKENVIIKDCRNETEIMELLNDVRIIFDMEKEPDLYLQIAGISAGVPMIVRRKSQYISHEKNGWILEDEKQLEEAFDYFLKGLENWNRSLVYSVHKAAGYTNGAIVRKWKELLEAQG
ncbi:MAG: accessory Sec system protein Asp1 [Clostridiales bacterium]|nr:accessory Sec system protein Asp1 [Clostridiales bacterium]